MLSSMTQPTRGEIARSSLSAIFDRVKLALLLAFGVLAMIAVFQPGMFWEQAGRVLPEQAKTLLDTKAAAHGQIPPWATWTLFGLFIAFLWSRLAAMARKSGEASPLGLIDRLKPGFKQVHVSAQNAGFVGLAVISAVLVSIASLYTTFVGSLTFFGYQPLQVVFGLFLALGIQGVCYMASWFVAEEMATRSRKGRGGEDMDDDTAGQGWFVFRHSGKILMLVIAMGASIFFSFAAHFENVYGPKRLELANLQNARADTDRALVGAEKAIIAERDAVSARLNGGREWNEFNGKLNAMLRLADDNPKFIQDQIKSRRVQAEAELAKTRAELQSKRSELEQAKGEIGRLEAAGGTAAAPAAGGVQTTLADQTRLVERLRAERVALEQTLQIERGPGNDPANVPEACRAIAQQQIARRGGVPAQANQPGGRTAAGNGRDGPVSRCILPLVEEARVKAAGAERELRRLTEQNRGLAEASAVRAQSIGEATAKRLRLEGEVKALESREKLDDGAVVSVVSSTEQMSATSGAEISKRVRNERDSFLRVGSKEMFDAMIRSCGSLQEVLRSNPGIASQMPQGACDTSAFASQIDRLVTLDRALTDFRKACKIDDAFNSLATPMDYVKKGSSCLALAQVPDRTQSEKQSIDTIAQLNHPDASNFERAVGSLLRRDMLAWLALALAFAVDVIVFLSAVLGAKHNASPLSRDPDLASNNSVADALSGFADNTVHGDEPPDIMRAKWLTQSVIPVPAENDFGKVSYRLDLAPLDGEKRMALQSVINAVAGFGLVTPLGMNGERFDIDHQFYLDCARKIHTYETQRARSQGTRKKPASPANSNGIMAAVLRSSKTNSAPEAVQPGGAIGDYPAEAGRAANGFTPQARSQG
jgi:hypothetical protein